MTEILKYHFQNEAFRFIRECNDRPLLYAYQVDGTPMLTRQVFTSQMPDGTTIRRSAGRGQ